MRSTKDRQKLKPGGDEKTGAPFLARLVREKWGLSQPHHNPVIPTEAQRSGGTLR
jgi:hypothetical protein